MKNILIIGGSNIDYIGKSFDTIRPYDSNIGEISVSFGGVARNICENLARLGLPVTFITAIGTDMLSQILLCELEDLGVRVVIPKEKGLSTGGYIAIHNQEGDMELALCDQQIIKVISKDYLQTLHATITQCDYLIIDTNLEGEAIDYLLEKYPHKTIIMDAISINKAKKLVGKMDRIHCLKCNVLEAEAIIGKQGSKEELAQEFIKLHANTVIITDKEKEIFYLEAGKIGKEPVVSVAAQDIINTTGVGDAMLSGIVYGLVTDKPLSQAIDYGKKLAALTLKCPQANNQTLTKEIIENE